jgi:hypothetical protein
MAGFAGAGKTTLATWLYEKLLQHKGLEWRVLDKDNLKRNHLAEGEEPELAGWNAYEDLFDLLACEVVGKGVSAIIDTSNEKPFIHENISLMLKQMERDGTPARLKVILCLANQETRRVRVHERGSMFQPYVDELPLVLADSELWARFRHLSEDDLPLQSYLQRFSSDSEGEGPFTCLRSDHALIVNTNQPLDTYAPEVWDEIMNFLKEE